MDQRKRPVLLLCLFPQAYILSSDSKPHLSTLGIPGYLGGGPAMNFCTTQVGLTTGI